MKKPEVNELRQKLISLNSSQPGDAFTREQLEIVRRIRNQPAHSHDLQDFSRMNVEVQSEKAELAHEMVKMWKQQITLLLQESESETESANSFASTVHESETVNSLPPKNAEFLLALILDKKDQEAAIGCFTELYSKKVVRWGKSRARLWAWVQVGKTLVPVLKRVGLKVSGLIAAYEWLKHPLS